MHATPAAAVNPQSSIRDNRKGRPVGRLIAPVLLLAIVAAICYCVTLAVRGLLKRHRQRQLARVAPQLLQFEDIDPRIAELLAAQQNQLEIGANIVSQLLNDPVLLIPSEYATPLELWLKSIRKELS